MDRAAQQSERVWTRSVPFADRVTGATLARPDAPLPALRRRPAPPPARLPVPTPPAPPVDLTAEFRADRNQIVAVLDDLRAATAELRADQGEQHEELRTAVVELALTIATRLFHRAVTRGEFPLEQIAREMSAQFVDEEPIRVRLNPDDMALLTARLGGEPLLPTGDPKLIADPKLVRGTVAIDGHSQLLVSDPVKTLKDIREELLRN